MHHLFCWYIGELCRVYPNKFLWRKIRHFIEAKVQSTPNSLVNWKRRNFPFGYLLPKTFMSWAIFVDSKLSSHVDSKWMEKKIYKKDFCSISHGEKDQFAHRAFVLFLLLLLKHCLRDNNMVNWLFWMHIKWFSEENQSQDMRVNSNFNDRTRLFPISHNFLVPFVFRCQPILFTIFI